MLVRRPPGCRPCQWHCTLRSIRNIYCRQVCLRQASGMVGGLQRASPWRFFVRAPRRSLPMGDVGRCDTAGDFVLGRQQGHGSGGYARVLHPQRPQPGLFEPCQGRNRHRGRVPLLPGHPQLWRPAQLVRLAGGAPCWAHVSAVCPRGHVVVGGDGGQLDDAVPLGPGSRHPRARHPVVWPHVPGWHPGELHRSRDAPTVYHGKHDGSGGVHVARHSVAAVRSRQRLYRLGCHGCHQPPEPLRAVGVAGRRGWQRVRSGRRCDDHSQCRAAAVEL
mmetsp:Transcript_5950/g.17812  ORF Transcript_5950/g.17812 Transcript_5950/m.17812 type:complete len:275 (+) Transcript_5950:257-1081(+)